MRKLNFLFLFFTVQLATARLTDSPAGRASCRENYSPCLCSTDSKGGIYVFCDLYCSTDGNNVLAIQQALERTISDRELLQIQLIPLVGCEFVPVRLPANFLSGKLIEEIVIGNNYLSGSYDFAKLIIDPLAFQSTQNHTTKFRFKHIDFALQNNFDFLNGFSRLNLLSITDYQNFGAIEYLPPLPSLTDLYIYDCRKDYVGSKEGCYITNFPDLSPAKLEALNLFDIFLDDKLAENVFTSLANSTSASSVQFIDMATNELTVIPGNLTDFPRLNHLDLQENSITEISNNSLIFTNPVFQLNLKRQSLGAADGTLAIESGTFQGPVFNLKLRHVRSYL